MIVLLPDSLPAEFAGRFLMASVRVNSFTRRPHGPLRVQVARHHPPAPLNHRKPLMVKKDVTVVATSAAAHRPSWPYFCARIG